MGLKKCLLALKLLVPVSMPGVVLHFHAFSRFWTVSRSTAKFGGVYTLVYFLAAFFSLIYLACLWLFVALGAYWLFDLCVFVAWLFVHFCFCAFCCQQCWQTLDSDAFGPCRCRWAQLTCFAVRTTSFFA